MAETVLKIILEGAEKVEGGLDGVSKAYSEVSVASKKSGEETSKAFKNTTTEAEKLNDTLTKGIPKVDFKKPLSEIQKLKSEIRQFTSDAIKAGEGTKAFGIALQEAGKRKAELKDLQQAVAALDPDTKGKAFLQLSQTIITGFAAGTGALAAFGVTTEDAQKTLVKLQAALAFGQFLGQVGELGDTFKILEVQIKNSAAAQKAFNLIAEANPYVLLAVAAAALGTAIVAMDGDLQADTSAFIENSEAVKKSREERTALQASIKNTLIDLQVELGLLKKSDGDKQKAQLKFNEEYKVRAEEFNKLRKALEEESSGNSIQAQKALADGLEDIRKKEFAAQNLAFADFKDKQLLIDAKATNEEIKALKEKNKKSKDEKDAANKKAADDQKALLAKLAKQERDARINSDIQSKQDASQMFDDELNRQETENKQIMDSTQSANDNLKSEFERAAKDSFDARSTESEKVIAKLREDEKAKLDNITLTEAQREQIIKDTNQRIAIEEEKTFSARVAAAKSLTGSLISLADSLDQAGADSTEFRKALALVNIGISIAEAIGTLTATTAEGDPYTYAARVAAAIVAVVAASVSAYSTLSGAGATPKPKGHHDGGYTGQGSEWDEAGVVHKGEFVMTKKKTDQHRSLFQKIHDNEQISLLDLAPLLKGTGVGLLPDVIGNASKQMDANVIQKLYQQSSSDKNIKELNENFKKFLAQQNGKGTHQIMQDGTEIFKKGSTTRIVRKRRI